MYNLKYGIGRVDLRIFGKVVSFTKSILPKRSYTSYDLELMNGKIFGNSKFEPLEMKIKIFVEGKNQDDLYSKLRDISNLFAVTEPAPLFINDTVYVFCMTNDDIETTIATPTAKYVTINLIALDPVIRSIKEYSVTSCNGNDLSFTYEGKIPTRPIIELDFTEDTHFCQLEYDGSKLLVGEYPKITLSSVSTNTDVLYDKCLNFDKCVKNKPLLLSGRSADGEINLAGNSCFELGSTGDTKNTWNGGAISWNLSKGVADFNIIAGIRMWSEGEVEDPNKDNLPVADDGTIIYDIRGITNNQTMNIRSSKELTTSKDSSNIVGKVTAHQVFYDGEYELDEEWIKIKANTLSAYASASDDLYYYVSNKGGKYWSYVYNTKSETTTCVNYKVIGDLYDTQTYEYHIKQYPTSNSNILTSVGLGTIIRCYIKSVEDLYGDKDDDGKILQWKKLSNPVNGQVGYILSSYLKAVNPSDSGVWIDTTTSEYAPNKTGVIELYGYNSGGEILFKFGIKDDNKYCCYNQPNLTIGREEVYQYIEDIQEGEKYSINVGDKLEEYTLTNGKALNYSCFNGKMSLKRVGNTYTFSFNSKNSSLQVVKTYTAQSTDELTSVSLYIGTVTDLDTSCDMYLDNLEIMDLSTTSTEPHNNIFFHNGDNVTITGDGDVYYNGILNNSLLNICSDLIEINGSNNTIKVYSDDENIITSIRYHNNYIGGEF